jgi:hypothetical protein
VVRQDKDRIRNEVVRKKVWILSLVENMVLSFYVVSVLGDNLQKHYNGR